MLWLRRVRQTTGFTGKDFQKTPNEDYMTMKKQLHEFKGKVAATYTSLKDMKGSTEGFAKSAKSLLTSPLPLKHDETAAVAGANVAAVALAGGPKFSLEGFSSKATECSGRMESEVLVPMQRWLDAYKTLDPQLKEVEDLRLEVDSRRHTVSDLSAQVDKYRAKLSKGQDSKVESQMEETIKKLQHKEGKLTITMDRFQEKATALRNNMEKLIKGAASMRHYLAVAFKAQADAYNAACEAIGPTEAPTEPLSLSNLTIDSTPKDPNSEAEAPSPVVESKA